jgi:hypothetical protein
MKAKNAHTDLNDFTNSEKDSDFHNKLNVKNNTEREYLKKIDFN